MEALQLILQNIANSASGLVPIIYTLLVASALDLASGVWAALKSGSFDGEFLPAWIGSHGDKIVKIVLVLLAGVSLGGIDNPGGIALIGFGGLQATTYLGGVIASIKDNVAEGNAGVKGAPSSLEPAVVVTNKFEDTPLTDVASPDEV